MELSKPHDYEVCVGVYTVGDALVYMKGKV